MSNFPVIEIKLGSEGYPELLTHTDNPPEQLYCRGNTELLDSFCIGVVGTRKMSAYGKEATEKIISEMEGQKVTIVSGLALGIDAVAHRSALDNGLPTIAVLGSGIDDKNIYPAANYPLAKDILKNEGLVISEYEPGTPGLKHHFPERNRIVSGLSRGVLLIEAPLKSGAMITTRLAVEYNRDVFAVPGNIFSPNSKGPNILIQKGAKPVFTAEDILGNYYENPELKLELPAAISTKDPIERKILAILDEKGELSADEIIKEAGEEAPLVITALSMLEIRNRIKSRGGKYQIP